MSHLCPRDGEALTATPDVFGPGAPAEVCPKCAGVLVEWKVAQKFFESLSLTLGDLQSAVAKAQRSPPKPNAVPTPCTACGKANLSSFVVKGVELDLCTECGVSWFDRGELARVSGGKLGKTLAAAPAVMAGERVTEEGVFEMFWDCGFCGTKALLGKSNRCCPSCGAAQDASKRYFPPPGQEVKANTEFDGADKQCPACNTPNGAKANNCRQCGSPLDGSQQVGTVADRVDRKLPPTAPPTQPAAKGGVPMWVWAVGALVAVACGCCGVFTFWTKESQATVSGHRWAREIDVESLEPKSDSSWCDSMPSGAYSVSKKREERSTKKIPDGEECSTRDVDRGDGTFKRQKECKTKYREEPVYDDKCYYTIDRWDRERTEKNAGVGLDSNPSWPNVRLRQTGSCRGCEREGSRREIYTVELKGPKGEKWTCDTGESKWRGLSVGFTKAVKVRVLGGGLDCDSL
jgi:Zn-finger nucleic acid-binding protein